MSSQAENRLGRGGLFSRFIPGRRFNSQLVDIAPSFNLSPLAKVSNEIVGIALDAKDKSSEDRVKAAESLLKHLTPDTLGNSQFYQAVKGSGHLRILQLLGTIIPHDKVSIEKFIQTERHEKIVKYLQGIVENEVKVEYRGFEYKYDGTDYPRQLASSLIFVDIPSNYRNELFRAVRLQPNSKK